MKFCSVHLLTLVALGLFASCNKAPETKSESSESKKAEEKTEEEGTHVKLTEDQKKNSSIKVETAGPAKIKTLLSLYGKVVTNEETLAHMQPRFPGIVKEVHKRLGDHVAKGDILAIVESNESLRPYEIKSETAGVVIEKKVTLGEFVKNEDTLFAIADLSTVWVDLSVFRQDFEKVKVGMPVLIHPADDVQALRSRISYISPIGTEDSQTMLARAELPNPKGDMRPGLFVTAELITGEIPAEVTVKPGALQTLKDKTIIFVQDKEEFDIREVEVGAKDGERVQILKGIKAGESYASEDSFILKSQALKALMSDED